MPKIIRVMARFKKNNKKTRAWAEVAITIIKLLSTLKVVQRWSLKIKN
jgi:hypothetical protein